MLWKKNNPLNEVCKNHCGSGMLYGRLVLTWRNCGEIGRVQEAIDLTPTPFGGAHQYVHFIVYTKLCI